MVNILTLSNCDVIGCYDQFSGSSREVEGMSLLVQSDGNDSFRSFIECRAMYCSAMDGIVL